jgi:signal transduction histidine kinase
MFAGAATLGSCAALAWIDRVLVRSGPPSHALVTVPAALDVAVAAAVAVGWPGSRARLAHVTAAAAGMSLIAALLHASHVAPREAFWILTAQAMLLLLLSLTVRWARRRDVVFVSILATSAGTLTMLRVTDPSTTMESLGVASAWALVAAGPVALGLYLRLLDDRRGRAVLDARRAQRLELAHDLHDHVAHDVTAMIVQAQAAQVVAARDPEEAIASLRGIEETGLHALGSLDRTVHALRDIASPGCGRTPAPPPVLETAVDTKFLGIEETFHLVGRFSGTDRMPVRLHVDCVSDVHIAPDVSSTAYRLVREALTNVRRHAPDSTAVDVRVGRSVDTGFPVVVVSVTNMLAETAARGRPILQDGARQKGLGLVGLAERIEAIGGSLEAGPLDGSRGAGWRIRAVLPLREST